MQPIQLIQASQAKKPVSMKPSSMKPTSMTPTTKLFGRLQNDNKYNTMSPYIFSQMYVHIIIYIQTKEKLKNT